MERRLRLGKFRKVVDFVEQKIEERRPKPEIPMAYNIHSYETREFLNYMYERAEKVFKRVAEVSLYKSEYFKDLEHMIFTSGTWRSSSKSYMAESNITETELVKGGIFTFNPYIACQESDDVMAFSFGHEIAHLLMGEMYSRYYITNCLRNLMKNEWDNGNKGDDFTFSAITNALERGTEIRSDILGFNFMKEAGYNATPEDISYDFQSGYDWNLSKYIFWDSPHSPLYIELGIIIGLHHPLYNFRVDMIRKYGGKKIPLKVPTARFYDFWEMQKEYLRDREEKVVGDMYFCHPQRTFKETAEVLMNDAYEIICEIYEENEKNLKWFLNSNFEREWYVRQAVFLDNNLKNLEEGFDTYPLNSRLLLYHHKLFEIKLQGEYYKELLLKLLGVNMKECREEAERIRSEKIRFMQITNSSPVPLYRVRPDLDKMSEFVKQFHER